MKRLILTLKLIWAIPWYSTINETFNTKEKWNEGVVCEAVVVDGAKGWKRVSSNPSTSKPTISNPERPEATPSFHNKPIEEGYKIITYGKYDHLADSETIGELTV